MSIIGNNSLVNRLSANNLPQQDSAPVGMTTKQADDLFAIAKTVYGSREKVKGGEGYIGAFTDDSGNVHLAKMMTHRDEYKGVKGKEQEYLQKMESSDAGKKCAKTLRDATKRICDRLVDIARAVGKGDDVIKLLGMKLKKVEGDNPNAEQKDAVAEEEYEYPPLLSRKIGIKAVAMITGNDGINVTTATNLKMRGDIADAAYDSKFDWKNIGAHRSDTIHKTKAEDVVSILTESKKEGEVGQKVGFSDRMGETVRDDNQIAYFKFIGAMKGKTKLSEVESANPGLIDKARTGQLQRLSESIETLRFDGPLKASYQRIMGKMVNINNHIADRAEAFNHNIGDERGEFKKLDIISLLSEKTNEIRSPFYFCNSRADEAFVYLLKKGMREEVEAMKQGTRKVPITPRELDDFMFRASRKAFICTTSINALFSRVDDLNEKLRDDYYRRNVDEGGRIGVNMAWNKLDDVAKSHYEEISNANLFGNASKEDIAETKFVKSKDYRDMQSKADIKRYRVVYATVLASYDTKLYDVIDKDRQDTFASAIKDGTYYNYDGSKEEVARRKDLIDRDENEVDYLGHEEDFDDPDNNGADSWGKLLQEMTDSAVRDTLLVRDRISSDLFNQGESYEDVGKKIKKSVSATLLDTMNNYQYAAFQ